MKLSSLLTSWRRKSTPLLIQGRRQVLLYKTWQKGKIRRLLLPALILIAITLPFFIWNLQEPSDARAGWLNDHWSYRKRIPISNSSGSLVEDFQLQLTLDTQTLISAGKLESDCRDLRFAAQGSDFLPYWLEPNTCNTSTTKVFVRVPEIPTTGADLWFYYGNPSALDESSAEKTFHTVIDNVASAWNMDDNVTGAGQTISDVSGNGNNGTTVGSVDCTVAGVDGTACSFSGGPYVDTYNSGLSDSFSVSVWVKPDTVSSAQSLIGERSAKRTWALFLRPTGELGFTVNAVSDHITSGAGMVAGQWQHVLVVVNGTNLRIYRNGSLVHQVTMAFAVEDSDITLKLGQQGGGSAFFTGDLDSIRVYENALSTDQAIAFSNSRYGYTTTNYPGKELVRSYNTNVTTGSLASEETGPGPIAHWSFDEGSGQTVNDSSGKKNHGTLGANSTANSDDPTWVSEDMCISGKCLQFDGSDFTETSHVANQGPSPLNETYTVSAWVRTGSTANKITILSAYGSANVDNLSLNIGDETVENAGKPVCVFAPGGVYSAVASRTINDNRWHHITCVKTGTSTEDGALYIDGELDTSWSADADGGAINTDRIRVGAGKLGWYFPGFIDEPKIYPYARTAAEVKQDYLAGLASSGSNAAFAQADTSFLNDGLVGYWPMNESASPSTDESGNGNNGTWNGNTDDVAGKFGSSATFDGTGDYIQVNYDSVLNTDSAITVSAWFKTTQTSRGDIITRYSGNSPFPGYGLVMRPGYSCGNTSGQIGFWVGDNTSRYLCSTNTYNDGTWHHAVGTFDGTTAKLYIDNQLVASEARVNGLANSSSNLIIGAGSGAGDFNGKIDEARIYNRALTANEVQALYTWAPGPVGHWTFDEGEGTTAQDRSSYENTGTLGGDGLGSDVPNWIASPTGMALSFDGDDRVFISDHASLDLTGSLSLASWVRWQSGETIINKNRNYIMRFEFGKLAVYFWSGGNRYNYSLPFTWDKNTWHHLAFTLSEQNYSQGIFYVNGTSYPVSATVLANQAQALTADVGFGSSSAGADYLTGSIDDVRIYNYARTQEQILQDMTANRPAALGAQDSIPTPVAHWKFDEGSGQTAADSAGSNNGTLGADSGATSTDPTWQTSSDGTCKTEGCLSFDGGDYLTIGDQSDLEGMSALSASVWVNTSIYSGYMLHKGNWGLGISSNATHGLYAFVEGSNGQVTDRRGDVGKKIADGQWHYITMVWNSSNPEDLDIYVDGKLDNGEQPNNNATGSVSTNNTSFNIGRSSTGGNHVTGKLDDLKIWNQALNSDQVAYEYNQSAAQLLAQNSSSNTNEEHQDITSYTSNAPPVAEWSFDELDGQTVNDSSTNANNGTLGANSSAGSDDPSWSSDCKYGGCLSFDGTDDYTSIDGAIDDIDPNAGTVTLWAKREFSNTVSSPQIIFNTKVDSSNNINIFYNNIDDEWEFRWRAQSVSTGNLNVSADSISQNEWTHISMTWNKTTDQVKAYINGQQVGSTASGMNSFIGTLSSLSLGSNLSDNFFAGKIDHVKIYDYARSPSQIAYDYNRGKPIAHWQLDECQGTTIHDASGNGHHGTLTVTGQSVGTCSTSSTAWGSGSDGKINSSLYFDGSGDYINFGDQDQLNFTSSTSQFTVASWVKNPSLSGHRTIAAKYDTATNNRSWLFKLYEGYPSILISDDGTYGTTTAINYVANSQITNSDWVHLAVTVNVANDTFKLYVNGKETVASHQNTKTTIDDIFSSAASVTVGDLSNLGNPFSGQIDDVKIWNYALSPAQVKKEYNVGSALFFGD